MKIYSKFLVIAIASVAFNAQTMNADGSLIDLFGKLKDSNISGIVSNALSSSDVKLADLQGTWYTSGPAVIFRSDDLLEKAGGAAASSLVEEKLAPLYSKLGADNTQITFDNNGNFTLSVKGKEVKGTVADNGDGSFSLKLGASKLLDKLGSDKSLTVYFQKSATDLAIAADATKLVNLVEKLASISDKATLNTVASLLEKYDQICIGLRMKK